MAKILIIDDDRATVDLLRAALSRYATVWATDGQAALHQVAAEHPDLVMLDLRMAGMDGAVLLPKIREISNVPVIVLSARHEQQDIVQAFKAGADDFVSKPFDLDDLEARVEAVLRRCTPLPIAPAGEIQVGVLTVSQRRRAAIVDGHVIRLTPTELGLLTILANSVGRFVDRRTLAQDVWGYEDAGAAHQIEAHIGRLRSKLRQRPECPTIIYQRGGGYMLQAREGES